MTRKSQPNETRAAPPSERPYRPRPTTHVSRNMAAVRGTGNRAEVRLRRSLWRLGYRYRTYMHGLPGRPDFTFAGPRVAVFVDADFWHARLFLEESEAALRESFQTKRAEWWVSKLLRNAERDQEVNELLTGSGWLVVRLWEKDILADMDNAVAIVAAAVEGRLNARE